MELLIVIAVIVGINWLFGVIASPSKKEVDDRIRLRVQLKDRLAGDAKIPIWELQVRGVFPVTVATDLGLMISIFDITDRDRIPVLAAIEAFQEPSGPAFLSMQDLGLCEPMQGFTEWVTVAGIPKDLLIYPHAGQRTISVCCRFVDKQNCPPVQHGYVDTRMSGYITSTTVDRIVTADQGYLERSDDELAVAAASIRLAVRLALADGHFADQEGIIIKNWAARFVEKTPDAAAQQNARNFVNEAIKWAVKDGFNGISISAQVEILNDHADKPQRYAALELCLDVMAADGVADKSENEMLNNLCEALDLSMARFKEMKEKKSLNLELGGFEDTDLWGRLDIDSNLPQQEKRRLLNDLYRKWNSRAESLLDDAERERAQDMLDLIASARHKLQKH
ncbi:MAG: TerB family tellurite resistance protein [Pseudomonadales bacterium]